MTAVMRRAEAVFAGGENDEQLHQRVVGVGVGGVARLQDVNIFVTDGAANTNVDGLVGELLANTSSERMPRRSATC